MRKIISILLAVMMFFTLFTACGKSSKESGTEVATKPVTQTEAVEKSAVKVATLMGPTGMGMAYCLDAYDYTVCASPDEITGKIVSGDFDIAALPTNAAATLYNKTNGKIKLLALNTGCVLYLLEKGDTIKDIKDLKGKTVYVSGQGSTPEYILDYLIEANGLKVGTDVKLDFTYATHNDLVAFAATGKADVVLLPEPTVTTLLSKNKDMRVALSLENAWNDLGNTDKSIAMGCLVVNTEFAKANPEGVKTFLADYKASVEKVTNNVSISNTSEKIAELGIVPAAGVAKSALPRCNIIFKTGTEMKNGIEDFLGVLYKANPNSVGGKMPDENFYYAG